MENLDKLSQIIIDFNHCAIAVKQAEFMLSMVEHDDIEGKETLQQKLDMAKAEIDKYMPAMDAIAKAAAPYHSLLYSDAPSTFSA